MINKQEQYVSIQYILCAAIYIQDNKKYTCQPRNIESGFVIYGRRHHNCYDIIENLLGKKVYNDKVKNKEWNIIDGFITSNDIFVTRQQAAKIALDAKQINKETELLISEDLY